MREASESLISAYREYLETLNHTSDQQFAILVQNMEFQSLNGQLQEIMTKYLVVDLSDDDEAISRLYLQNIDQAGQLLAQLQKMAGGNGDSAEI